MVAEQHRPRRPRSRGPACPRRSAHLLELARAARERRPAAIMAGETTPPPCSTARRSAARSAAHRPRSAVRPAAGASVIVAPVLEPRGPAGDQGRQDVEGRHRRGRAPLGCAAGRARPTARSRFRGDLPEPTPRITRPPDSSCNDRHLLGRPRPGPRTAGIMTAKPILEPFGPPPRPRPASACRSSIGPDEVVAREDRVEARPAPRKTRVGGRRPRRAGSVPAPEHHPRRRGRPHRGLPVSSSVLPTVARSLDRGPWGGRRPAPAGKRLGRSRAGAVPRRPR